MAITAIAKSVVVFVTRSPAKTKEVFVTRPKIVAKKVAKTTKIVRLKSAAFKESVPGDSRREQAALEVEALSASKVCSA